MVEVLGMLFIPFRTARLEAGPEGEWREAAARIFPPSQDMQGRNHRAGEPPMLW